MQRDKKHQQLFDEPFHRIFVRRQGQSGRTFFFIKHELVVVVDIVIRRHSNSSVNVEMRFEMPDRYGL
jgi:hypothetical protein